MDVDTKQGLSNDVEASKWIPQWLSWRPTSQLHLYASETRLLSRLKSHIEDLFVPVLDNMSQLRTIIARSIQHHKSAFYISRTPLVFVHGMAAGLGFWCKNLDQLADQRPVYAMDVLGFGRSSRPIFPSDPVKAEALFVRSLEDWRRNLGLEKFVLVGHSLGGFLSYSYAIENPHRISHLILVDPWGFNESASAHFWTGNRILKTLSYLSYPFNPLALLRAVGPLGPMLVRRFRQDLGLTFKNVPPIEEESEWILNEISKKSSNDDRGCILDYIYHCNAQTPSGEAAFKAMSYPVDYWSLRPMLHRVRELPSSIPVTFIYGGRSWLDSESGVTTRFLRGDRAYTDVSVIDSADHHVYAQFENQFNAYVNNICSRVDDSDSFAPGSEPTEYQLDGNEMDNHIRQINLEIDVAIKSKADSYSNNP